MSETPTTPEAPAASPAAPDVPVPASPPVPERRKINLADLVRPMTKKELEAP